MPENATDRDVADSSDLVQAVTGEMAQIRVVVEFPQEPGGEDVPTPIQSSVLKELRGRRRRLHQEIESEVRNVLGPDVEVDELVVVPGSLEIIAVLSTVGMLVGNFNELVQNLEKATEYARRAVRFVLRSLPRMRGGNIDYQVHGEWNPGPAMRRLGRPSPTSTPVSQRTAQPQVPAPAQSGVLSPNAAAIGGAYALLIAVLIMAAILLGRV